MKWSQLPLAAATIGSPLRTPEHLTGDGSIKASQRNTKVNVLSS